MRTTFNGPAEPAKPGRGLQISDHQDDGTTIVTVAGEIDMMTDSQLREHALRILAQQPAALVLRLEETTFLDSRGLAALVAINRRAGCLGVRLALTVAADTAPAKVLAISGLGQYLRVFGSLGEALADRGGETEAR